MDTVDNREHWGRKFNKSPSEYNLFRKLEAIEFAKSLKLELQKSYFEERIQNSMGDSKHLWKTIKDFWPGTKKTNSITMIHDYTADKDKATALNKHFSTVGSKLAEKIDPGPSHTDYLKPQAPIFDLKPISIVTS